MEIDYFRITYIAELNNRATLRLLANGIDEAIEVAKEHMHNREFPHEVERVKKIIIEKHKIDLLSISAANKIIEQQN